MHMERYKQGLIVEFYLLSDFVIYPEFQQAKLSSDYESWRGAGLDQFCNISDKHGMFSEEYLFQKQRSSYFNWMQYRQE